VYQEALWIRIFSLKCAAILKDYFQSQDTRRRDYIRQLPVQNDQLTVQYFISQGTRQKLAHIDIAGKPVLSTDTIRERMFLQPSSFRFRWGRYSDGFRLKDEETIATPIPPKRIPRCKCDFGG